MANKSAQIIANRYLVERCLGEGGMGMVFLARDQLLQNTQVAVKLLHRNLTSDPEQISRFLREMQTLRQINHANVVRIYDTGEFEGEYFYTMEFLQGSSLASMVDDPPPGELLPWKRLHGIFIQILRGLSAVHANDIVHRDIKPDNVILIDGDIVKLADFGIARTNDSSLTATQAILGTPCYIPPEIWKGKSATHLTDIYALGVLFFEMLTRQVPFPGDNPAHVMRMHLMDHAASVNEWRDDLPFWVDKAVQKMLEKDPAERPPNVEIISRLFENPPAKPAPRRKSTPESDGTASSEPESSGVSKVPPVRAPLAPSIARTALARGDQTTLSLSDSLKQNLAEDVPEADPLRERLERLSSGGYPTTSSGVRKNAKTVASSSSSLNRTMPTGLGSSATHSPAIRLELESPGKSRGQTARQRLRYITKRTFRKGSKVPRRGMIASGMLIAVLGLTAYPRTADWLELQLSRVSPKNKPALPSELSSVEHFVGAYYRNQDSREKLAGDFEVLQRELSVEVPEGDNSLKDMTLPLAGSVFLLSGHATQMEAKQETKTERKLPAKGGQK